MGVHSLWDLLAPVGRRVSVETLAGKRLAIDASIWMIQFMKAMRDEKGEMVRNAHVLGFFRRICKLLFLRTKPVFVFDGGTPALKHRTVIARRRQRENAQTKIRKTAEKLLLNHLKAMRLKELARELENKRQNNDAKGKKVISDQSDMTRNTSKGNDMVSGSYNQEALDEMLAASLAAEEDGSFTGNASTSGAGIPAEEEDDDEDEDEEMILPAMNGKVDPAVLAALPPSMQLDLLVQMRERLMAENRQKYQKVKKAPTRFSELQIQAYLKTVAFRREIDEVRKSAAGRGIGGVQTSRIASEANREFIFSSSFTGDKQVLTSAGVDRNDNEQHKTPSVNPSSDSLGCITSTSTSTAATTSVVDEPERAFDVDVETYLDERGRVRVSRVRAMGIRMTRDLQRNLQLMKETEQEKINTNKIAISESTIDKNIVGASRKSPNKIKPLETLEQGNDGLVYLNGRNEESMSKNGTSIEIAFEDKGEHQCDGDDDQLFACLVAGNPVMSFSPDNTLLKKQSFDCASDCEWEEGIIVEKGDTSAHENKEEGEPSLAENIVIDESDVEWEEGFSDIPKHASFSPAEYGNSVSKGALEEETDFQEAIRRSLEDLRGHKHIDASSKDEKLKQGREITNGVPSIGWVHHKGDRADEILDNVFQPIRSSREVVARIEVDNEGGNSILKTNSSPKAQLAPSLGVNLDNMVVLIDETCENYPNSLPELLRQDAFGSESLYGNIVPVESVTPIEEHDVELIKVHVVDTCSRNAELPTLTNRCSGVTSHISGSLFGHMPDVTLTDAQQNEFEAAPNNHHRETTEQRDCFVTESTTNVDIVQKVAEENDHTDFSKKEKDAIDTFAFMEDKEQVEVTEASLEEEIQFLGRERTDLGDEQRKLERNAESVSSEMFAECQELLQMFGLPYIIAPMEAEAQCAYMELTNLVDGVVTDDSDVFLFGARSVYKNIFDDRKYVETYFMKDIEKELGLSREKLIRMALLLGSDYTEGVSGIGIVNAIEVVNAFPEEDGLHKFREWIESPDPSILGKFDVQTGSGSRKRGSKVGDTDVSCSTTDVTGVSASEKNVSQSVDHIRTMNQIFMDKHRNVSKNWHLPSSFPSDAVISAYASPQVDKSTEPFSWGKPDLFVLRKLCWEKFAWGTQKADELLLPVLKEYNKHETQLRLEAFYTFNERFAKIRSKRIKKAVKGITGNKLLELMDDPLQDVFKSKKKKRVSCHEAGDDKSEEPLSGIEGGGVANKSAAKQSRKRTHRTTLSSDAGNLEPPIRAEGKQNINKGSRGRGRSVGRGRKKKVFDSEYAKTSSSNGNNSEFDQEIEAEKHEGSHEIRRSRRPRKAVKDNVNNTDESGEGEQDNGNCADIEVVEEVHFEDPGIIGSSAADQLEVGEHLLVDGLSNNYHEVGGGFCVVEAEPELRTGQQYLGQTGDPLFHGDLSEEYLKMGGGFCSDKVDKDLGEHASRPVREIILENPNPCCFSSFMEEAEHDIGPVQSVCSSIRRTDASDSKQNLGCPNETSADSNSMVAMSQESVKEDDPGTSSTRLLSAMPDLRRKRRKS